MGHGRFINEDSAPVNWNSLRSYENYLNDSYTFKETKSPNPAQKFPCIAEKCSRNSPDLPIQDNDVEELQVLVDNLNKYAAENSVLYERCKLFSLKQKIEESFEQFVSELISQAQKCMLGGLIDDLVKCMIILGVRDDRMKEKLLQDDGLSLKKAVETCLQMEKNKHCLARALYDNIPDTPDELHFRRGDTLIVLEQNTANIEGWWLCSLRGKQGICPANRLRLIPGVFEDVGRGSSPHHFSDNGDIIYLQRQGKRRSWHVHPNQVVTPKKFNDVYLYDMPPSKCSPNPVSGLSPGMSPREPPNDCYDTPPPAVRVANDSFRNCPRCSPAPSCASPINRDSGEAYDVPRSLIGNPNQLTPSSSASSLTADSLSSSNRSSLANMPDYDVPKPHTRGPQIVLQPPQHYDVPSQLTKELPLELNSALENLERLQTDTTSAISKLLGFVGHQWRTKERLESNLMEIRLSVTRLRSSLHDLAEFGEGTLGNAARASDKNLAGKLAPLVSALKRSNILVQEASEKLAKHNWSLELLARPAEEEKIRKPDELEQLVACSRALTEDIRQIASFIQGNGLLLFKKEQQSGSEWGEEYDYVSLDSRESMAKNHAEILKDLPQSLRKGYDNCVKHADAIAFDNDHKSAGLDADDKQLLTFYATQIVTHHTNLTHAIDAFIKTVEHNQPPKIFLAHGKFVVLSAHKLVLIGDTVYKNVSCREIKEGALNCANALADALASSVNKTKQAAMQFPSVTAVQEMVDSIVDISHAAKALKVCLVQAAVPL